MDLYCQKKGKEMKINRDTLAIMTTLCMSHTYNELDIKTAAKEALEILLVVDEVIEELK